jgi:hypothetical protein
LEGRCHGLIKVPSQHFPGLMKTMKNLSQDSQCPAWDSNLAPPKYKSRVLPLNQFGIKRQYTENLSKVYHYAFQPYYDKSTWFISWSPDYSLWKWE